MAEGKGGKILSITKKRAKRVQEKVRGWAWLQKPVSQCIHARSSAKCWCKLTKLIYGVDGRAVYSLLILLVMQ